MKSFINAAIEVYNDHILVWGPEFPAMYSFLFLFNY